MVEVIFIEMAELIFVDMERKISWLFGARNGEANARPRD